MLRRNHAIATYPRLLLFVIAFGLFLLPGIRVKAADQTYCQDRDCSVADDPNPQWAGFKVLTFTCKLSPMRIPSTGTCADAFPSPDATNIIERPIGSCPGSYVTHHLICPTSTTQTEVSYTVHCPSTGDDKLVSTSVLNCCVTCNPSSEEGCAEFIYCHPPMFPNPDTCKC